MTLYEYLYSGFGKAEDLNCAEKMLYGANKVYELGINRDDLKLAAGFGGGMAVGITCGILTGGIMAFAKAFIEDRGHEGTLLKEIEAEYINKFNDKMNSINCDYLVEHYRDEEKGCDYLIFEAAKIFDELMEKYKDYRKN
ncbi:C-GCAxxG-C-C family protein [Brachyspira hyodysenteriae]|uniref:Redox-active protein n=1 Tax=Brachyspira hyodysenteriae ATCC 27164 TaxID=1266923 RepID=A0A3B6VYT1_BRAHO|nr:C-GCAxxG-C-C family (seleno)protein [Brachyspira hyodysenteriae]ANN63937.1 redox-active protein [Brachyspira hyodysenteriae ATCC 27164]AUJ49680.1 Putative redox-active protein (C_GCAxxG_C_C) [Brachyspira hyodysenteriae]KLI16173.1 redox-active protein [Brachyspira hyodysenteriae]KLI21165.1 redox-active protein [Brachyspira hyodysenteriae]KLI23945.1 redox-active protein [Brachyspira hyodysenteriae]